MYFQKLAIVNILGGLGNQLHQIAFAKYLEDQGYIVKVNLEWFHVNDFSDGTTPRELHLDITNFGLTTMNKQDKKRMRRHTFLKKQTKLNKLYHSKFNLLIKFNYGNYFDENKFYKFNYFDGYWQNKKYLNQKKEVLLDALKNQNEFLNSPSDNENKTMIHIRKGDYIEWGEELSLNYFENAIKKLEARIGNFKYDIFTDGEIIKNLELFKSAQNIFSDLSENPLTTLSRMRNYENYIISNSSLSFFGAFLSKYENKVVIYPKPWFKSIDHEPYTEINWSYIER